MSKAIKEAWKAGRKEMKAEIIELLEEELEEIRESLTKLTPSEQNE